MKLSTVIILHYMGQHGEAGVLFLILVKSWLQPICVHFLCSFLVFHGFFPTDLKTCMHNSKSSLVTSLNSCPSVFLWPCDGLTSCISTASLPISTTKGFQVCNPAWKTGLKKMDGWLVHQKIYIFMWEVLPDSLLLLPVLINNVEFVVHMVQN